jgi:quinol monooxygenase YgiN
MIQTLTLLLALWAMTPAQNSDPAIYVVTYVDVQPSSAGQGVALIRQYRDSSRREAGNQGVDAIQESSRPNRFVIVEIWRDQASFDAHEKADTTSQFRSRLRTIHNSPYDQRVHRAFTVARPGPADRNTLSVVTHVDVPPPSREQTEGLLRRLAEESRKEQANVRYDIFQQISRTNHFTVVAAWRDDKAFEAHEIRPHTREFREALAPMLGALYDERLYKPVN